MVAQILVWSAFFYSFPALTLAWEADYGWTLPQIMGAFSVALFAMALSTPIAGGLIDKGHGPALMFGGVVVGAVALAIVATAPGIWGFYGAWAVIGICMGTTLYEPTFAMLLRARGDAARGAITAISIVAGFASLVTFPFVHWVAEVFDWRLAPWLLASALVLVAAPLLAFSTKRLEAETSSRAKPPSDEPVGDIETSGRRPLRNALAVLFLLPALASGLVLSQILPLLTAVGYSGAIAVGAAAWIGPMQVLARLITTVAVGTSTAGIVLAALLLLGGGVIGLLVGAPGTLAVIAFVVAFGAGNGLVGILRPVFVRDVLGQENLGANAGQVARPALLAVAAAPFLGAIMLAFAGPGALLLVASAAPLAAAALLGRLSAHRK